MALVYANATFPDWAQRPIRAQSRQANKCLPSPTSHYPNCKRTLRPSNGQKIIDAVRRISSIGCYLTFKEWWSQAGSNRRPPACKAGALPSELWPLNILVGLGGLEPPTSPLSGVCSSHLSYRPETFVRGL